ncbi:site-specific integrase [Bradyrhizobium sp. 179]|uniref:tyrosine-type recombinase/integrase n=1 Tax=Bradyrhizobium sp. 179 TaxID=2782648 RepID=UPI001FF8DE45|nr:site-specific integrase [Bradyrhizobium sp. 179]
MGGQNFERPRRLLDQGVGVADDYGDANGKDVLQAQGVAKQLARGGDGAGDNAPITVDVALKDYKRDLEARGANPYNAESPRVHLTAVLLATPVLLLTATELRKWRDGLLGKIKPATINRVCRCLCAALEQARQHDERIQNRQAWEVGLVRLPDAQEARNVILSDDKVRDFVSTAYAHDHQLELLVDTLAVTGARPSQAVRLRVEDFHDDPLRPKLMMPKSAKGGGRNRAKKKHERYSVPTTVQLATNLRQVAKGRADDAPLLLQSSGTPWGANPGQTYHRQIDKIVAAIGLDPSVVTIYALRHSSIVRMLLQNIPIRLVASLHNTSVQMIERTYSKYITEHSDDISRKALLRCVPPIGDNVIAIAGRSTETVGRANELATAESRRQPSVAS